MAVVTMKTRLIFPTLVVVLAAACGGDDGVAKADQKNFEVVQEGSASGVTSTIQGPGESLPPITSTNADTTTAFTIDPNAAVAAPPPSTAVVGGGLPPMTAPTPIPSATPERRTTPPQNTPRPNPREMREDPRPVEPAPPQPTMTAEPTPAPPQEANPVPPQKEQNEDQEPESQDEPQEDPPPPPTTTDTRGPTDTRGQ